MKTLLCCLSKNNDNYIKEFIEYYQKIGLNKMIIYNNSDFDTYSELLSNYINNDFLILDNTYISKPFFILNTSLQKILYTECYKKYYKDYDWIIFIDDDEYIELENFKNINDFLSQEKFNNYDCIRLCWKLYDDNNIIIPKNYTIKNFTHSITHRDNRVCKSIIRGLEKLSNNKVTSHGMYNVKSCDALGNECWCKEFHDNIYIGEEAILKEAWINHYRFKTLYEYIFNKRNRANNEKNKIIENNFYPLNLFFEYNEKTEEKLNYLKSIGINYE